MTTPTQDILFLGFGSNRDEMLDTMDAINHVAARAVYRCIGYLDDDPAKWGMRRHDIPVLGGVDRAREYPNALLLNTLARSNSIRIRPAVTQAAGLPPERYVTLIDPQATVARSATIGRGCLLLPGARVGASATLHDGVILLQNTFVGHDSVVGMHTCFAPGAMSAGFSNIGPCCYIGMQSAIRESITIGEGCVVGLGSTVIQDVEPNCVVAGNPARILRRFDGPVSPDPASWNEIRIETQSI
ncbi:MAG: hypothetical protein ACAI35_10080 [Candidatus Methylacidiphilales bacterium]